MARWHLRQGRVAEATDELVAALRAYETDPWPWPPVMIRALDLARSLAETDPDSGRRLLAQLERPFAVRMLDEKRLLVQVNLARKIDFPSRCASAFEELEPHVPWTEPFLRRRLECYEQTGHRLETRARRQLEQFRSLGDIEIWWGLLPDAPEEAALDDAAGVADQSSRP